MKTLYKAAQAALNALEQPRSQNSWYHRSISDAEAAKNLRAALAQEPAQQEGQGQTKQLLEKFEQLPAVPEPVAPHPEAQYVSIDELGDLPHVTPAERWLKGELDRIDPHRHEQGHDGAEAEALRKLVFEFHHACDLLISHCNKYPTMGDSMFSVLLMRQLLGRGRDAEKGQQ